MTPIVVAGIATGAVLRLMLYFSNRPLWYDESSVALNIGVRGFRGLLRELDFGQGAPPLFLFAAKLSTVALGMNELALRLPALVAGLLLLATVPLIARRLGSGRSVTAATWLVALSPLLVNYSNEVKQYGQEALMTSLLILPSIPVLHGESTARQRLALTLLGAIAIWASLPSAFVLCVIAAILLLDGVAGHSREGMWFAGTAALWLITAAAAYLLTFRAIARDPYMIAYWRTAYLPANLAGVVERLPEAVGGLPSAVFLHRDFFQHLPEIVRIAAVGIFIGLAGYGVARLTSDRGWRVSVVLAGPIGVAFVAFLLRKYPFTARLLAFAAPSLALLVAAGFAALSARWPRMLVATVGVVALMPATYHALLDLRNPARVHINEHPVLAAIMAQRRPDEPVYLTAGALQPWIYYTTDWDAPDVARIRNASGVWHQGSRPVSSDSAGQRAKPQLAYRVPPYNELYAVPSGIMAQFEAREPGSLDPSWGVREAQRIRAAARPCIWIFGRDMARMESEALFTAVRASGGVERGLTRVPGSSARRLCFTQAD